jgi:hypothetical protein
MPKRLNCTCDNIIKGKPLAEGQCPHCWLFWHNEAINRSRGGDGAVAVVMGGKDQSDLVHPCIYRVDTGRSLAHAICIDGCPGGIGSIQPVRRCTLKGECTIAVRAQKADGTVPVCCRDCKERVPRTTTTKPTLLSPPKVRKVPVLLPPKVKTQAATTTLPVRMVMPSDKRPVWRGGVLQIWVTRACDRACYGCTQGSNLSGAPELITPDQFRAACESIRDYWGVVGVFGGNPTLHPQFGELCRIMREVIPFEQRGLWSNHPRGRGRQCAITFNPEYSNLNVHQSQEAYDEFATDWPECKPYLKGLDSDSRHSPPFVAMKDVIADEAERWRLIGNCDINKNWSALIGVFRGQLRGWFCEIAGSQSMLYQHEPDYPDTGVPIVPGWWKANHAAFEKQIQKHCHECGIPLKGHGELANAENGVEQVSATHAAVYRPKRSGRTVEVVTELLQLGVPLQRATDYIENGGIA